MCASCEAEQRSIRQVKMLLRSLHEPRPGNRMEAQISMRLDDAEQPLWRIFVLTPPRPQRGRRFATALALSCLTVLSFAASLAPASRDGALTTSGMLLPIGFLPARPQLTNDAGLASWSNNSQADVLVLTNNDSSRSAHFYSGQYIALPSSDLRVSALSNAPEPRYNPATVSFVSYSSP